MSTDGWREVTIDHLPEGWGAPAAASPATVRLRLLRAAARRAGWSGPLEEFDPALPSLLAEVAGKLVAAGVRLPCVLQPAGELTIGGFVEVGRLEFGSGGSLVAWPLGRLDLSPGFGGGDEPVGAEPPDDEVPRMVEPSIELPPAVLGGGDVDLAPDAGFPTRPILRPPVNLPTAAPTRPRSAPSRPRSAASRPRSAPGRPRSAPPRAARPPAPLPTAAAAPPPPPSPPPTASGPRLLQCRVGPAAKAAPMDNLLREGRNRVGVFLGPKESESIVGGVVPDSALLFEETDGDVVEVRVQLSPLDPPGNASSDKILVPRSGRSNTTSKLAWDIPAGTTSARALLQLNRGRRTIYVAVLTGTVGGPARLELPYQAADPRAGDVDRSLTMVAGPGGKPAVVVPGREVQIAPELRPLAENVRKALNLWTTVSLGTTDAQHQEAVRGVLVKVAQAGADLFLELDPLLGDLAEATSLQVITSQAPNALPVELLYTHAAPLDTAALCPTWLAGGTCSAACVTDEPATVVCPAGFWGIGRVVERHYRDKGAGNALLAVTPPDPDSPRLNVGDTVLAAASLVTNAMLAGTGFDTIERLDTWDRWGERVSQADSLVVLMPHTEPSPARMEISGNFLPRATLQGYLNRAKKAGRVPTVVLFGCDTGGRADDPVGYTGRFLGAGAAIVFASLCLLLAEEAPQLASRLVKALRDPAREGQGVARLLTDVRTDALRAGFVSALALTSFGSTDWEV